MIAQFIISIAMHENLASRTARRRGGGTDVRGQMAL